MWHHPLIKFKCIFLHHTTFKLEKKLMLFSNTRSINVKERDRHIHTVQPVFQFVTRKWKFSWIALPSVGPCMGGYHAELLWIYPFLSHCFPFLQRTDTLYEVIQGKTKQTTITANTKLWNTNDTGTQTMLSHGIRGQLIASCQYFVISCSNTWQKSQTVRNPTIKLTNSPLAWSISFKTNIFSGRGLWERVSWPPHLQPYLLLPSHKANSTWDNQIKSELKVQTSNNSQSVLCVSGKPQRALIHGPVQKPGLTYQFDLITLRKQNLECYPQSCQQRCAKKFFHLCPHEI